MKIINNVATCLVSFGLTIYAGVFLFGAGSLTVLGWLFALPVFVGAGALVVLSIYNMIPEAKEKDAKVNPPAAEKHGDKPGAAQPAGATV